MGLLGGCLAYVNGSQYRLRLTVYSCVRVCIYSVDDLQASFSVFGVSSEERREGELGVSNGNLFACRYRQVDRKKQEAHLYN